MKEGHDGSGVGVYLNGLGGPFEDLKDCPVLSGIVTDCRHEAPQRVHELSGVCRQIHSFPDSGQRAARRALRSGVPIWRGAYEPPRGWKDKPQLDRELELVRIRVELRDMGLENGDIIAFSFWPDTIMIKEVGDPMTIGEYLHFDREEIKAKRILAQGRQNTNYAINLYACHPFFIQGVCTMTNGENTAFIPIKEYLSSRNIPGYMGYNSDSEVFAHIMHFTIKHLGLPLEAYKHIITPLRTEELAGHPNEAFLKGLKNACRKLIIDGPNCIIGCLPDQGMFMVQDRKKLRPGIVGGKPGIFAFSSEACGLNSAIPDRDRTKDFQPMHLDTVYVGPECQEAIICNQNQPLPHLH